MPEASQKPAQTCAPWPHTNANLLDRWQAMRRAPPLAVVGWKSADALGLLCNVSGSRWKHLGGRGSPLQGLWKPFGGPWKALEKRWASAWKSSQGLGKHFGRPWTPFEGHGLPLGALARSRKAHRNPRTPWTPRVGVRSGWKVLRRPLEALGKSCKVLGRNWKPFEGLGRPWGVVAKPWNARQHPWKVRDCHGASDA